MTVNRGGRPRSEVCERRSQHFLAVFAKTGDPVKAAEVSGHPALRALETLRDHGFILTSLKDAA